MVNSIYVYQLASGTLSKQTLTKVYGSLNLYRDVTMADNVDHLEEKFALLEGQAYIAIRSIHNGLQCHSFTLSRMELATVRKFIFLMHYRTEAASSNYFQETEPRNVPIAEWIRTYKASRRLQTGIDVWRDGLKYYLDTPHSNIMATGERLRERYGDLRLHEMLRERFDPGLEEEWFALDYWSLANYFFLGVWEAAEGSEFVLGGTAFGLWEGLIHSSPGAHRLYVVSPRVAIVLRRTFLRQHQSNDASVLYSCLADIPIRPPKIKYADKNMIFKMLDGVDPWIYKSMFDTYLSSKKAQDDEFTFPITKLSIAQTYSVNEVIMMNANLHPEGSLTFSSPEVMLDTLKMYMRSHNTFLGGKRKLFQPLLKELFAMIATGPTGPFGPSERLDLSWTPETDADLQLQSFLRFIISKVIHFPSNYNRAYVVFHMATEVPSLTNSVSARIRSLRDQGVYRFKRILDPPIPSFQIPSRNPTLVETLPKEESELFFALVGHQVDRLGVGKRTNDLLANIIYDAAVIGITHWLADNRNDVLSEYLYPWMSVTF